MAVGFTFEDTISSLLYIMAVMVGGKLFGLTGGTPLVVWGLRVIHEYWLHDRILNRVTYFARR